MLIIIMDLCYASFQVRFEEIFGEPDPEIFSFDKIWLLTFKVQNCYMGQKYVYISLKLL